MVLDIFQLLFFNFYVRDNLKEPKSMKKILLTALFITLFLMPDAKAQANAPASNTEIKGLFASGAKWNVFTATINNVNACILVQSIDNFAPMDEKNQFSYIISGMAVAPLILRFNILDNNWDIKDKDVIELNINGDIYKVLPVVNAKNKFSFYLKQEVLIDFLNDMASSKNIKLTDVTNKKVFNIPLVDTTNSLNSLGACFTSFAPVQQTPPSPQNTPQITQPNAPSLPPTM
jgi:hypothetical protein